MSPTYRSMTFVILDKGAEEFCRGDVVAFRQESVRGVIIKRIVGIPGDTLSVFEESLYINGEYSGIDELVYTGILSSSLQLGGGEYFMMGDNRAKSCDSRYPEVGIIQEEQILGKVIPQRPF